MVSRAVEQRSGTTALLERDEEGHNERRRPRAPPPPPPHPQQQQQQRSRAARKQQRARDEEDDEHVVNDDDEEEEQQQQQQRDDDEEAGDAASMGLSDSGSSESEDVDDADSNDDDDDDDDDNDVAGDDADENTPQQQRKRAHFVKKDAQQQQQQQQQRKRVQRAISGEGDEEDERSQSPSRDEAAHSGSESGARRGKRAAAPHTQQQASQRSRGRTASQATLAETQTQSQALMATPAKPMTQARAGLQLPRAKSLPSVVNAQDPHPLTRQHIVDVLELTRELIDMPGMKKLLEHEMGARLRNAERASDELRKLGAPHSKTIVVAADNMSGVTRTVTAFVFGKRGSDEVPMPSGGLSNGQTTAVTVYRADTSDTAPLARDEFRVRLERDREVYDKRTHAIDQPPAFPADSDNPDFVGSAEQCRAFLDAVYAAHRAVVKAGRAGSSQEAQELVASAGAAPLRRGDLARILGLVQVVVEVPHDVLPEPMNEFEVVDMPRVGNADALDASLERAMQAAFSRATVVAWVTSRLWDSGSVQSLVRMLLRCERVERLAAVLSVHADREADVPHNGAAVLKFHSELSRVLVSRMLEEQPVATQRTAGAVAAAAASSSAPSAVAAASSSASSAVAAASSAAAEPVLGTTADVARAHFVSSLQTVAHSCFAVSMDMVAAARDRVLDELAMRSAMVPFEVLWHLLRSSLMAARWATNQIARAVPFLDPSGRPDVEPTVRTLIGLCRGWRSSVRDDVLRCLQQHNRLRASAPLPGDVVELLSGRAPEVPVSMAELAEKRSSKGTVKIGAGDLHVYSRLDKLKSLETLWASVVAGSAVAVDAALREFVLDTNESTANDSSRRMLTNRVLAVVDGAIARYMATQMAEHEREIDEHESELVVLQTHRDALLKLRDSATAKAVKAVGNGLRSSSAADEHDMADLLMRAPLPLTTPKALGTLLSEGDKSTFNGDPSLLGSWMPERSSSVIAVDDSVPRNVVRARFDGDKLVELRMASGTQRALQAEALLRCAAVARHGTSVSVVPVVQLDAGAGPVSYLFDPRKRDRKDDALMVVLAGDESRESAVCADVVGAAEGAAARDNERQHNFVVSVHAPGVASASSVDASSANPRSRYWLEACKVLFEAFDFTAWCYVTGGPIAFELLEPILWSTVPCATTAALTLAQDPLAKLGPLVVDQLRQVLLRLARNDQVLGLCSNELHRWLSQEFVHKSALSASPAVVAQWMRNVCELVKRLLGNAPASSGTASLDALAALATSASQSTGGDAAMTAACRDLVTAVAPMLKLLCTTVVKQPWANRVAALREDGQRWLLKQGFRGVHDIVLVNALACAPESFVVAETAKAESVDELFASLFTRTWDRVLRLLAPKGKRLDVRVVSGHVTAACWRIKTEKNEANNRPDNVADERGKKRKSGASNVSASRRPRGVDVADVADSADGDGDGDDDRDGDADSDADSDADGDGHDDAADASPSAS